MAKLTTKQRKNIPSKEFGLPKERKYPMQDKSHAANAKARASQQLDKGNLSETQKKMIDQKANKVLAKSSDEKRTYNRKNFKSTDDMRQYYKKKGKY